MLLDLQSLVSLVPQDTLFVLLAYGLLAGLYLLVVPLGLFLWMNSRWHRMSNIERLVIYGMVFLFFPGMVLFAPFLNFRLSGQGDN
ncbi:MAG: NAD(P)H-quinone oxidoreductase subunit L [Synechococcus sp. BS307-5m-G38]|jgi:NAD(P)H-quinone oxidoreductase subunit L|nr:NAD(P)H-quinone oxidoreductase subunit L [Synechococcus sp. BS307-5m-G38]|tara:strand:- start:9 stop:266 length:258 start_codon:yes stop_codon:yes gene_type:complete